MRAFLSHSSVDKGFVEGVADHLRPGTYELDSVTFDQGGLNPEVIRKALIRCDLFCLFLSNNSTRSSYVEFETLLGMEFFARGIISKFLIICIDEEAFNRAADNIKIFNIVRKINNIESASRLILGQLVTASSRSRNFTHPFIGRESELENLDRQVSDPRRPTIKCIYLSGNAGTGRRALAQKFYENYFPHVGRFFPSINFEPFDGAHEIYRNVIVKLRPTMTAVELRSRMAGFEIADKAEQARLTAEFFNSLLTSNEAAFVIDDGGVLNDAGKFVPEIAELLPYLEGRPHPPVVIISPRMVPNRYRQTEGDVAFVPVRALDWGTTLRLISALIKQRNIAIEPAQMDELTKLSDGHPYNIYHIVEEVDEQGPSAILANPTDIIEWKHRQSSEYIRKIKFSNNEVAILTLLKGVPELDFEELSQAIRIDNSDIADALSRLLFLHVINSDSDQFSISPALRIAVERDARIKITNSAYSDAMKSISKSLSLRLEDGTAPVSMVNSAVLSGIESGGALSGVAAAFLLPSHYVRLAKARYDQHDWSESIRFGLEALGGHSRLSINGLVATCRYLCLAAARTGEDRIFEIAINKLEKSADDHWARSNVAYLKGFRLRMKGRLPAAQELFEKAYEISKGNISAIRELAAIALVRGDLTYAENRAREAYEYAQGNPYLVDMLLAILIRKGAHQRKNSEIDDLFRILEGVGEENGRSFYTTRKAEAEYLWGDNKKAVELIEVAAKKTPTIFEVRRLQTEIYLKAGNKTKASEAMSNLTNIVENRDIYDRRSNYRVYLETKSHYLVECGRFDEAKELFEDEQIFTEKERQEAVRDIEIAQGFKTRVR